jgi:hypothetical protein
VFGEPWPAMNKRDPDWCYVPPGALPFLVIPCIAVLAGMLFPIVARLKTAEVGTLYGIGVAAGVAGALLLLLARLPLYRERRFWAVGPRQLDQKHRRLYWLAYALVTVSVLLLLVVWLRTR